MTPLWSWSDCWINETREIQANAPAASLPLAVSRSLPQPPAMNEPDSPTASRGSLAIIFLTVFIDLLGFAMVLPLLPVYAKKFNADESGLLIATLMASFSVMQFLFAPLWGRLSDRIGRRPVLLVGLAGAAVFYSIF